MRLFQTRNFNAFSAAGSVSITVPAVGDVRAGVEYGEDDSLTGTAIVVDPVTTSGFSQFDTNQISGLDSQYANQGRPMIYNGTNILGLIVDQQTQISQDEQTRDVEHITVMVRRYGANLIERPQLGDTIELIDDAGVDSKKFKLTKLPAAAFSHLEWELIFSRTKTIHRGGSAHLPYRG